MATDGQEIQPTKTSQPVPYSPPRSSNESVAISATLSCMALHYWRPDFTPTQAKLLLVDYLSDLAGHSAKEIEAACAAYRKLPDSRFFPTTGQLLALMKKPPAEPTSHLPTFERRKYLEAPRASQSIGDVLRKHGHGFAAEAWESRRKQV